MRRRHCDNVSIAERVLPCPKSVAQADLLHATRWPGFPRTLATIRAPTLDTAAQGVNDHTTGRRATGGGPRIDLLVGMTAAEQHGAEGAVEKHLSASKGSILADEPLDGRGISNASSGSPMAGWHARPRMPRSSAMPAIPSRRTDSSRSGASVSTRLEPPVQWVDHSRGRRVGLRVWIDEVRGRDSALRALPPNAESTR